MDLEAYLSLQSKDRKGLQDLCMFELNKLVTELKPRYTKALEGVDRTGVFQWKRQTFVKEVASRRPTFQKGTGAHFYVYVILTVDEKFVYVGQSPSPIERCIEHSSDLGSATSHGKGEWVLVWVHYCGAKTYADMVEKMLHSSKEQVFCILETCTGKKLRPELLEEDPTVFRRWDWEKNIKNAINRSIDEQRLRFGVVVSVDKDCVLVHEDKRQLLTHEDEEGPGHPQKKRRHSV
jgi:predicted GIY-YIG superfamily endonuclease